MEYGQAGAFYAEGGGYIGFLFDAAPADVRDDTPIVFIEVTVGERPGLTRDGC